MFKMRIIWIWFVIAELLGCGLAGMLFGNRWGVGLTFLFISFVFALILLKRNEPGSPKQ